MMRGMFAAISGLRTHQVMMDVTANDIANANTIGYKSARATFKDSLAQMQRGAAAPRRPGRRQRRAGRPRRAARLDRQPDGRRRAAEHRRHVRRGGPGRRVVRRRAGSNSQATISGASAQFTRAGNFTTNANGDLITQEGSYVVGRTAAAAGGADPLLNVPTAPRRSRSARTARSPTSTRRRRSARSRATSARDVRQPRGPRAQLGQPVDRVAELGRGADLAGRRRGGQDDLGHGRDVQRGPRAAFTNMITAQRGFQAYSRVISTSDEMLQDLVNIKR